MSRSSGYIVVLIMQVLFINGCATTNGVTLSSVTGDPHASLDNTTYHATFSQNDVALPDTRLSNKVVTTARFFLGPRLDRRGGAVSAPSKEMKDALAKNQDSELIITMTCFACSEASVQSARVAFKYSEGVSDEAVFHFIPDMAHTDLKNGMPSGLGTVSFSVSLNGLYVDNVPVSIVVVPNDGGSTTTPAPASNYAPPVVENYKLAVGGHFPSPDLVISVGAATNGNVTLHFVAPSPRVVEAFKAHAVSLDELNSPIDTGIGEKGLFGQQTGFYCKVSQLLSDPPAVPAGLVDACGVVPGSPMKGQDKELSPDDSNNLLSAINDHGYLLYHSLFNLGDSTSTLFRVAAALKDLSKAGGADKIKLVIDSYRVYIPWQMLSDVPNPLATPDPAQAFWGFRYLLSVLPSSQAASAPFVLPGNPKIANSLFVTYRSPTYWGSVAQEASSLEKSYFEDIKETGDPSADLVSSVGDFYSALNARGPELGLIVVHSHAKAAEIEAAEKIFFHEKDEFLQPYDLDIDASKQEQGTLLLQRRPVVILNACETGATGYVQPGDGSFVGVFFRHGASGVIATQAKVPQWSAFNIVENILHKFASGESIAEAVTSARELQWYGATKADPSTWKRDPSGLLYAYYGPSALRIKQ